MTDADDSRFCPYVGLRPYSEGEQAYFFGRERDTRIIAANLHAARLTVLYGASGVGKSSVLSAGVLPRLRQSPRTAALIFNEWQSDSFGERLKKACLFAVQAAADEDIEADTGQPLDSFLQALGAAFGGTILLLFDQFEEYFLYHAADAEGAAFDAELARAINRDDLDANFLISLREDGLAGMDRFRARIPNLLANMLRLDHIDFASAEAAIRKPVEVYNERDLGDAEPVQIDDALIPAVLAEVRTGRVRVGDRGGVGRAATERDSTRVETPFLQLVLERLWEEDVEAGPRYLRQATFERLGGAQEIVSSHLDRLMRTLDDREQAACARFFDRLVTPSGTKIAYPVQDLAASAGSSTAEVNAVLGKLSDARILRTVEAVPGEQTRHVEIFHDVLAPAILRWVAEFERQHREAADRRRRRGRMIRFASVLVLLASVPVGIRLYAAWIERNGPWAFLENLSTGSVYAMTDDVVSVGRSTSQFSNVIDLKPRTISRKHLLIYRDGAAHDLRSRNGTTVNAKFLQYGSVWNLKDGDVVTLAGLAPFRYHAVDYGVFQLWEPSIQTTSPPSGAWAMILDGPSRKIFYLYADVYYLWLDDAGRVVLERDPPEAPLMIIRRTARGIITIEDMKDDVALDAQMKEGDYDYPSYRLAPGVEYSALRAKGEPHDLFELAYRYRGTPFQLIPLIRDLERHRGGHAAGFHPPQNFSTHGRSSTSQAQASRGWRQKL